MMHRQYCRDKARRELVLIVVVWGCGLVVGLAFAWGTRSRAAAAVELAAKAHEWLDVIDAERVRWERLGAEGVAR